MTEFINPSSQTESLIDAQAVQEKKGRIETSVMLAKNGRPRSLHERMTDYTIPGVSIAVINDYQLEWACGYGLRKNGEPGPVDTTTLFQACSISKAVTAIAVLRLVQEKRLDLDTDINRFLKSWKVRAQGSWQPEITIRQVLSHTAGINVPWFAGYHREQDIPTWPEILSGEQPGNTPEICVNCIPGVRFRYSGGGYCILQQLLMDVMGKPFPALMDELVLSPLKMRHSTYEQPLSTPRTETVAAGHRKNGKPVAGDWYVYPELAAAGLWTTPSDLAQFALALQYAQQEKPHPFLSKPMMKELLTPQSQTDVHDPGGSIGLGVFMQGTGPTVRFGHPGDNAGFTGCWISLVQGGQGCIIMTNSDNGWSLQQEILQTIEKVYAWPEPPLQTTDKGKPIADAAFASYVGEYELQSNLSLTISQVGDHLFVQMPDQSPLKLVKQHDGVYYSLVSLDETITFLRNRQGDVQALLLRSDTSETLALKRGSDNQFISVSEES